MAELCRINEDRGQQIYEKFRIRTAAVGTETGSCWAARQEHLALVRRYRAPVSATEGAASSGAGLPSGAGGAAAARDESDRLRSTLATEGTRASLVSFAFALLETADFQCLRRAQGRCVGGAESSSTSSGVERGCAEPRYARIRRRSAERARAARGSWWTCCRGLAAWSQHTATVGWLLRAARREDQPLPLPGTTTGI